MSLPIRISIQILKHGEGLDLPSYATEQSAGMDLRAALDQEQILHPGQRYTVPCGFCMALPKGFEGQIRSRSGLSANHGVVVLNAPGTIDSDHRGEIRVVLINLGQDSFAISRGMRIAQLVVAPVVRWEWVSTDTLDKTPRGLDGFGSTGLI